MDKDNQPVVWQKRIFLLAGIAVFLLALLLRLGGMLNDFWFDEIWSWGLTHHVSSGVEIFTKIHHDNNHWLNTLYIYCLGDQPWPVYRLFSLVCGVGSVAMGWRIGRFYGRLEGFFCLILIGFCYLLIHYSSEARGYAPAAFFALTCFSLMQGQIQSPHWLRCVLFAVSATLGFLSHLTFAYCYAGFLVWSGNFFLGRQTWYRGAGYFLGQHLLPLATVGFLFLVNRGRIVIGSGEARPTWDILIELVHWTLGVPPHGLLLTVAVVFVAIALVVELWWGPRSWEESLFYAMAILIAPALILLLGPSLLLYPRYFLLTIPFLLILLGRFLARCCRAGGLPRLVGLAALLAYCLGNFQVTMDFLQHGRGNYSKAIRYLIEQTPGEVVTIGSENEIREKGVLNFYVPRLSPAKSIILLPPDQWSPKAPFWFLVHRFHWQPLPAPFLITAKGSRYILERTFAYSGASGWDWLVYRLQPHQNYHFGSSSTR